MKIIRNGHEYELTSAEMRLAYDEQTREYDREDLRTFFNGAACRDEDLTWFTSVDESIQEAIIEHLAERYREKVDEHTDIWENAYAAIWELDNYEPGWRENITA